MKSSKKKITAVLLAAAFMVAGCGDSLYVLTPEEEDAIVSYASRVVAKYNTYQQDGEIFVMKEVLDGEDADGNPAEENVPAEESAENTEALDTQEETDTPEQKSPDTDTSQSSATISEALNLGKVQASYTGSSLCATYAQSDVYAVDAKSGRQLLVVNVDLSSEETKDLHLDILQMKPSIQIIINETETAMAETTILPNDLSTFQGDVKAGQKSGTVLLFEISNEIQEITSLQLKINLDGEDHTVNL